jgi:hypothetical protein
MASLLDLIIEKMLAPNDVEKKEFEQVILDPLTTIARISSLQFRPQDTKLTFSQHSLTFDLPTNPPILQGIKRRWSKNRSSKNDIALLKQTILLFIKLYNPFDSMLEMFANGAIKGLTQLKKCYTVKKSDDLIIHCIEFYITILQNAIDSNKEESKEQEEQEEKEESKEQEETEETELKEEIEDKETRQEKVFKNLWSESKKLLIHGLLTEIQKQYEEKGQYKETIEALDILLLATDKSLEQELSGKVV